MCHLSSPTVTVSQRFYHGVRIVNTTMAFRLYGKYRIYETFLLSRCHRYDFSLDSFPYSFVRLSNIYKQMANTTNRANQMIHYSISERGVVSCRISDSNIYLNYELRQCVISDIIIVVDKQHTHDAITFCKKYV